MSNKGTSSFGGTPSRLSAERGGGSGWNTPSSLNTWNTEATPSYTASSLSGPGSLGTGVAGPAAGAGQSSLDDVCDVCVCPLLVCFCSYLLIFTTPIKIVLFLL